MYMYMHIYIYSLFAPISGLICHIRRPLSPLYQVSFATYAGLFRPYIRSHLPHTQASLAPISGLIYRTLLRKNAACHH